MRKLSYIVFALMFAPALALAQTTIVNSTSTQNGSPVTTQYQFSQQGVFGCNAGQYGGSPGTTAAIGGVFVPVNFETSRSI